MSGQRKPNYTLIVGTMLVVVGLVSGSCNHNKWFSIGCTVLGILVVIPGIFIERLNRRS